jgi:uncharacterized protein YeaO (DUF488 family)
MGTPIAAANVKLKRAYAPAAAQDGLRILVDRLWPRGVSKAEAALDQWDKEIAPSPALRKWFGHDPDSWAVFRHRYAAELVEHDGPLQRLRALARRQTITLVYAAHDEAHTHAIVLRDVLLDRTPLGAAASPLGTIQAAGLASKRHAP